MRCHARQLVMQINTKREKIRFCFHSQLNPITNRTENGGAMNCRRDANLPIAARTTHTARISIIVIVVVVVCVPNGHKFVGRENESERERTNKPKQTQSECRTTNAEQKKNNPNIHVIGCVVSVPNMPTARTHTQQHCCKHNVRRN